ncbi:MAG: AAA family ATPase [Cognatishimia sp.]
MLIETPTLHLMCGKIASGKSTQAAKLGEGCRTVVISEDDWLAALYLDEMSSLSDYVRCSSKLQKIMELHIVSLLNAEVSVVLDFPANTISNRAWMRGIIQTTNASHKLHYLDVPDDVCKARLHARNSMGDHPFAATEEQFVRLSEHFAPPTPEEGFDVVVHSFT